MGSEAHKRKKAKPEEPAMPESMEDVEGMQILHDSRNNKDMDEFYDVEEERNDEAGESSAAGHAARQKKDRFLPISILVAAVIIGGSVLFAALYHGGILVPGNAGNAGSGAAAGATTTAVGSAGTGTSASDTAAIMTLGPRDAILGNANAPVTIVEYGDYQCPYCGEFFSQTESSIVSDYINTGKAKMVFRNFAFLGPESTAAAEAAECAEDQNDLWAYHDALYTAKVGDDEKGGSEDDGFFTRALFIQLAQSVGMDVSTFTACIDSNKYATTVADEKTAASALGIDSTPTFYINGTQILGAEPYSTFQQTINAALQG